MPLKLTIKPTLLHDPETDRFIEIKKPIEITMEHSLLAVAKWESKWMVPFTKESKETFTREKLLDYFRCMTITPNVDPNVFYALTRDQVNEIVQYMNSPMTATTIKDIPGSKTQGHIGVITSEVLYYQMAALRIPFECQKWHLNRLLTLLKIGAIEQQPPKKMGKREALAQRRSLNSARKAKHHTRG